MYYFIFCFGLRLVLLIWFKFKGYFLIFRFNSFTEYNAYLKIVSRMRDCMIDLIFVFLEFSRKDSCIIYGIKWEIYEVKGVKEF